MLRRSSSPQVVREVELHHGGAAREDVADLVAVLDGDQLRRGREGLLRGGGALTNDADGGGGHAGESGAGEPVPEGVRSFAVVAGIAEPYGEGRKEKEAA